MRSLAVVAPLLAALLTPLVAQSPPPVFVEVVPARATVYVEQPLHGVLRIGYDAAFFRDHGVDLFAQRFDLPFGLRAAWFEDDERRTLLWPSPGGEPLRRGVVGADVRQFTTVGERRDGDRVYTVLEAPFVWLALAADAAPDAAVQLRYAFANAFTEDFLRGRQPVDKQEATVFGNVPEWTVRDLPTDGRPDTFHGAVGRFEVRAATSAQRVEVGQGFPVTLTVMGDGNLQRFAAPPPPELSGFHVQGVVERRVEPGVQQRRVFEFDLLPLRAGITELPPLPFCAFDPEVGRYVTRHTSPVPLTVLPAGDAAKLPARVRDLIARDAERHRAANALPAWLWLLVGSVMLATVPGWLALRRRGERRTALRAALQELHDAPAADAAARLAAFERVCALAVGHAGFGPEVWQVLVRPGIDAEVVAAVRRVHGQLADAVYGGVPPDAGVVSDAAQQLVSATA